VEKAARGSSSRGTRLVGDEILDVVRDVPKSRTRMQKREKKISFTSPNIPKRSWWMMLFKVLWGQGKHYSKQVKGEIRKKTFAWQALANAQGGKRARSIDAKQNRLTERA